MAAAAGIIIKWAFGCRLFSLIVQAVLNLFVNDYDSSSCCTIVDGVAASEYNGIQDMVFGGLLRWDSVFFLHIATSGYTYEHFAAFFPVWPIVLRMSVILLKPVGCYFSDKHLAVMSAFVWTSICLIVAAVVLYYLGKRVLEDEKVATCAALLFCFNPATVFVTAAYSGGLFAVVGFSAMLAWAHGRNWLAAVLSGVAGGTRSNGALLIGFLLYGAAKKWLNTWLRRTSVLKLISSTLGQVFVLIVQCCIAILPFSVYQYYIYYSYCVARTFSFGEESRQFLEQPFSPPWCNTTLPLSYSSIQSRYWNVGFLRYFQMKQVPNFILASPVIIMIMSCVWSFCRFCPSQIVWTLGLLPSKRTHGGLWNEKTLVFVFHAAFLVLFGVTTIHVQVLTRLLATSTPVLYWYAAHLLVKSSKRLSIANCQGKLCFGVPHASYLVLAYFLGYAYLGLALHTNFYPWT